MTAEPATTYADVEAPCFFCEKPTRRRCENVKGIYGEDLGTVVLCEGCDDPQPCVFCGEPTKQVLNVSPIGPAPVCPECENRDD
jgi:hypothetical protein